MEIIFPQDVHDVQKFLSCAEQLDYDEFSAQMFVFCNAHCDVDVFELMGNDRLAQLIYGWEVCRVPSRDLMAFKEPALRHLVLVLAHHSLQMWFSQEWITCSDGLKHMLLYSLTKAVPAFYRIEELANINWAYVLKFQTSPWSVPYLQKLFAGLRQNKHHAIEHAVAVATVEDITFLKVDGLNLILLRLMQLFNAGNFEAVKQLSLRMLAAWLKANELSSFESLAGDKTSIALVGHLYLLTVFAMDENRGYAIDNLMYNIRFYAQSMQEYSFISEGTQFTPARLIAQVCVRLRMGKSGFFEQISFKNFKLNLVTSFAVMLEAYTSYVLGNQLVELMALNEHDFLEHSSQFKELMHRYVAERESSERFLLEELKKLENQRNSHFQPHVVKLNINYQQQICKGNRASNIGNYKNCDDDEKPLPPESEEEQDRQIDPVFQSVPNNEEILDFVYKLLAEREFSGWKFAKIAILLKIIGQQLNAIEIWRYHPGLTTDFMLNLEQKMSQNYADLAKVFSEHGFMEAEFWLTAFYLNPIAANYNEVRRCSRIKKKRQEEDNWSQAATASQTIKYELLSSTIDVDEIVTVTNHNAPVGDYDPIYKALQALRLPPSMIKDLLTVVFQPRNKRYSWALDWFTLHERCHALLKSRDLKNKFVALNMAEASDRLEYLKIDYAKYRDRPQLDYGTIEEGYENAANLPEPEEDPELTPNAKEEEEDVKAKQQKKRRPTRKFWDEVFSEDEEEEVASSDSEAYYTGNGRRKRIRAAAMVANAMLSDMDRSARCGRRSSSPAMSDEFKGYPTAMDAKSETEIKPSMAPSAEEKTVIGDEKRTIGDLLEARTKFSNETGGFKAFADIWSFEKEELQNVASEGNSLMECSSVLSKFKNWKSLKESVAAKVPPVEPQPPRRTTRTGSETESIVSEASSMATHYFNEEEPSDDLLSGVSKELTPSPPLLPVPKLTMETEVLQPTETNKVGLSEQPPGFTEQLTKELSPKTAPQTEQPFETSQSIEAPSDTRQLKEELIEARQPSAELQATEDSLLTAQPSDARQLTENHPKIAQLTAEAEKPKHIDGGLMESAQLNQKPIASTQIKKEPLENGQPNQEPLEKGQLLIEGSQQAEKLIVDATKTTSETETDTAEETRYDDITKERTVKRLKLEPIGKALYTLVSPDETADEKKVRERLTNECLHRSARVCLNMLTVQDIEKLRGVRVRVKRTNLVDFYRDQMQCKRRKITGRRQSPSRSHTEDSTASTQSSDAQKLGRRRFKKFVHITSDSLSPGTVDIKPLFKHITSDSSTDLEEVPHPVVVVRRRGRGRGRGAGPRCKTQAIRAPRHTPSYSPDVIELSSDSLSSNSPVPTAGQPMHQFSALELDPLYEEEIVPF